MTRIHGDFHLGQVLVASGDAYIIDFEGEPATSVAERRAKTSPLRDVAGLLRSIDYAGATLIERQRRRHRAHRRGATRPAYREFRTARLTRFPEAATGRHGISSGGPAERALLELFLLEKAAYEVAYESANRPTWIGVPPAGLTSHLAKRIIDKDAEGHG